MSDEKYDDLPYVAFIGAYANVDDAKADFDGIKALHADHVDRAVRRRAVHQGRGR